MRVLVDECLPRFLRHALPGHSVETAQDCGWSGIKNGELLRLAEERFDVFLTGDKNLRYQQNLKDRKIAIIELSRNSRVAVRLLLPQISEALETLGTGVYVEIHLPK
jgi:predicted nuclease of predicted toxin-antitoxin system